MTSTSPAASPLVPLRDRGETTTSLMLNAPSKSLGRLRSPAGGLLRVEQLITIGVKLIEHPPRAEEFVPNQITVIIAVHALKPDRSRDLPSLKFERLSCRLIDRSEQLKRP